MNLSQTVKTVRLKKGYSQKELADKIGVQASNLCEIEKGNRPITLSMLARIAEELGVSVDLILLLAIEPCGLTQHLCKDQLLITQGICEKLEL